MRATLDYAVARQIIADGLWPDMSDVPCRQPQFCPSGRILFFHKGEPAVTCGAITVDGEYDGPLRNVTTLQQIAAEHALDLKCVITRPPGLPTPKKVKQPRPPARADKPAKKPAKPPAPIEKQPLSLAQLLKARKAVRT